MQSCAIAYDGRETAQRALRLVARFASVTQSTVHVIHATVDPTIVRWSSARPKPCCHCKASSSSRTSSPATPGAAVARVIERTQCDALFAGAHVGSGTPQ